jgi:hypothetical protein
MLAVVGVGNDPSPTLRFADAARRLTAAARAAGLSVPAFRSPPRLAGAPRSIRRYPGGTVVSVRLRDRPFGDVAADMVEGVLAANRVAGPAAERLRAALSDAVGGAVDPTGPAPDPGPPTLSPGARVAERQTQAA